MNGRRFITIAATALALVAPAAVSQAQDAGIMVGAAAPGASVESLEGQRVELASYIGKQPVVLEFWATWCPLCKQLEPSLQAARTQYEGRATFVSIGVRDNQSAAKQKAYAASKHLGGEFVFDRDGKAVAAYKAPHTSYIVVIDAAGKVVYTGVGPEQDVIAAVAKAFPMPNAMSHGTR